MPTDAARIKELGHLGEADFKRLCITARVTSSRPDVDENGWDFFVEMPASRVPAIFLDAQPSPIKLLCQVEATDNFSSLSLPMKVSNWEHLAKTILPTFLFIIDYRGLDQPQAMYLCHYDQERITQTLKRIRELEAEGKTNLHIQRLLFAARSEERFEAISKTHLLTELRRYTGIDASLYAANKSELLCTRQLS